MYLKVHEKLQLSTPKKGVPQKMRSLLQKEQWTKEQVS